MLNHFLDWIDCFLWLYGINPLIVLNQSFGFTESPSPQQNYSEPSLSQRRRLAKSITSPRQLVEFKGEVQSIHKSPSDNPKSPSNSPEGDRWEDWDSSTPILRRISLRSIGNLELFLFSFTPILRRDFKIICGFWVCEFENLPYFCKFEGSVDYKNHWFLVLSHR